jgi:hypothetical protein
MPKQDFLSAIAWLQRNGWLVSESVKSVKNHLLLRARARHIHTLVFAWRKRNGFSLTSLTPLTDPALHAVVLLGIGVGGLLWLARR